MIKKFLFVLLLATVSSAHDAAIEDAINTMFVNPTHTSISGSHLNWNSPSTWVGNSVPNAGSKVLIPVGSSVDFTGDTARIFWIRVKGQLGVASSGGDGIPGPPVAMTINCETIIIDPTGGLVIGSPQTRISKPLIFNFIDSGSINTTWDTMMLSRGIIIHGNFAVHAERVTPEAFTLGAIVGATTVTLQGSVVGWRPGDSLVLPGVAPQQQGYAPVKDDDLVFIQSINGQTVTLTSPLRFAHPSAPSRPMPVANISRRVIFKSENTVDISRRAHFMIMTPGIYEDYAVEGMGRTNKAITVTDPPNIANTRGRYSQHVHLTGILRGIDPVVTIRNVSVFGDPGWAFVCHSSNCDFDNNVAYNVVGSGFTAETGNEIGIFRNNLAIRITGFTSTISPPIPDSNRGVSDFAFTGWGFWSHGGMPMEGNIATGCSNGGIMVMGAAFRLPGGPVITYPTNNLIPPLESWHGQTFVYPYEVPTPVTNNIVYGSLDGVSMWSMGAIGGRSNAIALGKFNNNYSEVGRNPLFLGYSSWQELKGNTLRGTGWMQTGISNTGVANGINYIDNDIRGFSVGIHDPTTYENQITGNTIQALTGILLYNTYQSERNVIISSNTMIPLPQSAITTACVGTGYTWPYKPFWRWQSCVQKEVTAVWDMVFTSLYAGSDPYNWAEFFNNPNYPDQWNDVLNYGTQRLYLKEYDPATTTANMTTLPTAVKTRQNGTARTVGDLRTELGLYLGNVVMPLDVTTNSLVVGVLSPSARVQLPKLTVNPNLKFYQISNLCSGGFTLKVKNAANVLLSFGPISLVNGWNFPIVPVDGYNRGVPVYCDPAAVSSGW